MPIPPAADRSPMPDRLVQAVLWDMDGTIVDTEPYWIQAEKELVAAHGGTWTDEQAEALVGQSLMFSGQLIKDAGVDLTVREIVDTLLGKVCERVRHSIPWRPGARELLAELKDCGIPCALVTMSETVLAEEINARLPQGTFELLVTGDKVTHGKPHPEAYQTAFDHIAATVPGLSKDRVVAIEDSLPGVTAAQAAGLVTIAVPHFVPLPPASERTEWSSLEGRTLSDLNDVVAARLSVEEAAR